MPRISNWKALCVASVLGTVCSMPLFGAAPAQPKVKVIPTEEQTLHTKYRRVLVGPGIHQPEPYQGFTGFVGWEGVVRTRTGALLMTFTSGYWHGSPPTP